MGGVSFSLLCFHSTDFSEFCQHQFNAFVNIFLRLFSELWSLEHLAGTGWTD